MLFYEPLFLFLFFPAVMGAFLIARRRAGSRAWVLLVFSLLFYLWSQPLFVPVVLATCVTDYGLGRVIAQPGRLARKALALGVITNLSVLIVYKYANFGVDNLNLLLRGAGLPPWQIAAIALPVGISFITFEKISYLVDIARGRSRPAPDFPTYLLYVFLFPKLLAGPIIKYHELEAQLLEHGHAAPGDLATGFARFSLGVVKKTMIANTLSGGADMMFNADAGTLGCADAWWGVLFFAFQIYIDFSAYSDMAIGLARMFGFRLNENFNSPYISGSITEFWRRWHISFTSWVREYLYIPLGGNRVPAWRRAANLWICFLLSGLWHGAAWHFVAWGAYNGIFLVLERMFMRRLLAAMPRLLATAVTFFITLAGWTLFRASSLPQAFAFFHIMARPGLASHAPDVYRTPSMLAALAVAAAISFVPGLPGYDGIKQQIFAAPAGRFALNTALSLALVLACAKALADPFQPFLYFRF